MISKPIDCARNDKLGGGKPQMRRIRNCAARLIVVHLQVE
jgi:hypothetical protein